MNGALETLISQAIGAATQNGGSTRDMASIYLNRGRLIILVALTPIILILMNIDKVLVALG
jgi:hypothetical protein